MSPLPRDLSDYASFTMDSGEQARNHLLSDRGGAGLLVTTARGDTHLHLPETLS